MVAIVADIARPALADVLAALADSTRDRTPVDLDYVRRALVPPRVTNGKVYAPAESSMSGWYLRHDSTAEAVEALATAGLWPWEITAEQGMWKITSIRKRPEGLRLIVLERGDYRVPILVDPRLRAQCHVGQRVRLAMQPSNAEELDDA